MRSPKPELKTKSSNKSTRNYKQQKANKTNMDKQIRVDELSKTIELLRRQDLDSILHPDLSSESLEGTLIGSSPFSDFKLLMHILTGSISSVLNLAKQSDKLDNIRSETLREAITSSTLFRTSLIKKNLPEALKNLIRYIVSAESLKLCSLSAMTHELSKVTFSEIEQQRSNLRNENEKLVKKALERIKEKEDRTEESKNIVQHIKDEIEKNKIKSESRSDEIQKNQEKHYSEIKKQIEEIRSEIISKTRSEVKILQEINEIQSQLKYESKSNKEKISEISNLKVRFDGIEKKNKNGNDFILRKKDEFEKLLNLIKEKEEEVEIKTKFISESAEYIDERKKILDKLIGSEAGASLSRAFEKRQRELKWSVFFWGVMVLTSLSATSYLIYKLFPGAEIDSTALLIASLKLIPAAWVTAFCIMQYTRERQFQEEYAFKSAVSLTIEEYASKIDSKIEKDNFISSSVKSIYQSPIPAKSSKNLKIDTKEVSKATAIVKDLASTITKKA